MSSTANSNTLSMPMATGLKLTDLPLDIPYLRADRGIGNAPVPPAVARRLGA